MISGHKNPVPLAFLLMASALLPEPAFALSYSKPVECRVPWMIALPWILASLYLASAVWASCLIHARRWRALIAPAGLFGLVMTIDAMIVFLIEPENSPYGLISLNAILGQVCADYR